MEKILETVHIHLSSKVSEYKQRIEETKKTEKSLENIQTLNDLYTLYNNLKNEFETKCLKDNELSLDERCKIASQILNMSYDEFRIIRNNIFNREGDSLC